MNISKKAFFGWTAGAVVVIGGAAAASTLVIAVTGISAGDQAVGGGCDNSISFSFGAPQYDVGLSAYKVTTVDYDGLDTTACDGRKVYVTLADSAGVALTDGESATIQNGDPASGTITLGGSGAQISQIDSIAAAIS